MSPGGLCLVDPEDKVEDTVPFHMRFDGTGACGNIGALETHAPRLYGLEDSPARAGLLRSPAEELQYIRQQLCLNMSDLASLLGVSRPTAYAWLAGDEPKEDNYTNIVRLSRVASQFEGLDIAHLERLMRRPIFGGRSLLDKLRAAEDVDDCIPVLIELADREAAARSSPKGSGKSPNEQGVGALATPLYESS